ncbi:bromodomain-containing protein 8 isoform X6 [Thunnus albacares]|uniref:bromodomain-containing protein 8 isoform X4 n=1 Tax=Thunnus maccoyii TaxID=8240 RepID=UPI001C4AF3CB|nr:bromodomain-containing protein 8 isoform X4 [Thunnus maccoyii]XP_044227236.1 bromodomain-containing protein 8 isoform X6 [Thunnus albacares]
MGCRDDRKMANGVGKHKLLVIGPTEPWSVREKLCLATSVMKSGDQNWVSVSRAIKPFAEPGRPPDWFSQKHCASKYSELLERTEAPKRKRGEKGEVVETVEDVIVRRLTAERIDELKKLIKETQEKHRKLKRESELIQAGHLDSKLEELWEEILQKKKLEEEEAELKRKTTDVAYQARQVAKSMPKRVPGVTMHSPSDCSSPGQEFSPGDPLECLTLDHVSTKNASGSARLMSFAESPGSGNDDISHGSLLDDPTQKKLLGQRGTPPPSPLLSELLKKGSILATNSRLIGESDGSTGSLTGAHDLQLAPPCQPLSQATGAPMLSRLLEAGPTQFSAQLGFMVSPDSASSTPLSAATPVPVDSTASACTEVDVMVPSVPPGCQPASAVDKISELSEEDVTVSYMGDELDLKTVGDIIAIIEDKEMRAEDGVSVGGGKNASGTKVDNEVNGPEVCGEEDGDGVEGFLSEADGETELEPAASESEDGYSLHTASSSLQLHTTADSIPSSPASSQFSVCSEDLEALQAHKIWKKAIMLVWRAAANHRYANVFLQPVTDEIAPGYHSIVHRPMDLATIKKNIETGLIRTTAEFQRDIMLMFQNAVMYNSLDHDVYHMAVEMQRDVLEQIQQFLATQLIMETSESGISAKSLRGRESTRKQDSTDKDTVSMSSPAFLLSLFDGGTRGRRCAIEADLKMKK